MMIRLRFTVRWMMALVAIVALGIGAMRLTDRAVRQFTIARDHASSALEYRRAAAEGRLISGYCAWSYLMPLSPELRSYYLKRADHLERLGRRHLRYARHPWLPVEPDPPEPR